MLARVGTVLNRSLWQVVFGDAPPTLSLVAPAKVNLFLRILRKREDGFHELASFFQTVSLFDDLDFWAVCIACSSTRSAPVPLTGCATRASGVSNVTTSHF